MEFKELYPEVLCMVEGSQKGLRVATIRRLSTLITGAFLAKHCQLDKVANKLPWDYKPKSLVQKLERFLKDNKVEPLKVYAPFAKLLFSGWKESRIRLIIDRTFLGIKGHNTLFIALAYKKRALPLAWMILDHEGNSSLKEQWKLIKYLINLIPKTSEVVLIGDREFQNDALMDKIFQRGWHFRLRLKNNTWITLKDGTKIQLRDLPLKKGQRLFLEGIYLTEEEYGPVNLACSWDEQDEDDDPWYIATDEEASNHTLKDYSSRMWIDETFRDLKEQGFHLDKSHLPFSDRLSRLILVIVLCYVWLMQLGARVVKVGWRRFIDCAKKRSLSYFQLGLRWFGRLPVFNRQLSLSFHFYT
jgi:hypothetical protein